MAEDKKKDKERGTYIGNIETGGGDFVGRDSVSGDKVMGDKIGGDKISVGDISGSGIAIGRGASASVSSWYLGGDELERLFAPLAAAVKQAPTQNQAEAQDKLHQLEMEVAKGHDADDVRMAGLIDDIVRLVPDAGEAIISIFGSPSLAGIAGPVTDFILTRLAAQ